jgi:hypothetical protein
MERTKKKSRQIPANSFFCIFFHFSCILAFKGRLHSRVLLAFLCARSCEWLRHIDCAVQFWQKKLSQASKWRPNSLDTPKADQRPQRRRRFLNTWCARSAARVTKVKLYIDFLVKLFLALRPEPTTESTPSKNTQEKNLAKKFVHYYYYFLSSGNQWTV